MRRFDLPYLADWFAISLRWMVLLGCTLSLALMSSLNLATGGMILFLSLWNLAITLLAIQNRRLPYHRVINGFIDLLVSVTLFYLTGGLDGPLFWTALIVIMPAAIYFEWKGGLAAAAIISLFQVIHIIGFDTILAAPVYIGLLVVGNLLAGGVMGVIGSYLMRAVRQNYLSQVNQRLDAERRLQHQERDRMSVLYNMVETMSATLNYQMVLESALNLAIAALGETDTAGGWLVCAVMLFRESPEKSGVQELHIEAAHKMSPADQHRTFPAEKGALRAVLQSGEPGLIQNPAQDPELKRIGVLQTCHSALLLPLHRARNAYGVMLFAHPDPAFFTAEHSEMLEMLSHQATVAIQNARMYADLQREKERIIESQEEARKKLARDLHDGPTQSVAAIAMRINVTRKMLQDNPKKAAAEMEQIEELARRTTKEIRHMLFTLRPLVLESEGLVAALRSMADKMRDTYQQNVLVEADEEVVRQLEIGKQTVVFFLAEEAVTNARKHAKASQIWIRLYFLPQDVHIALLEIFDDGVGFNVAAVTSAYERRGSLGLVNLQERADLLKAVLDVESSPGRGTRVRIFIPLDDEAAEHLENGQIAPRRSRS